MVGGRAQFRALPKADRLALRAEAHRELAALKGITVIDDVGPEIVAPKFLSVLREVPRRQPREFSERATEGYVYIIRNPAWPGYVKIGCAGSVGKRLSQFNTGSPLRDYEVVDYVFNVDRRKAEASVHAELTHFRVAGEWFRVELMVALEAVEAVREPDPAEFMLGSS